MKVKLVEVANNHSGPRLVFEQLDPLGTTGSAIRATSGKVTLEGGFARLLIQEEKLVVGEEVDLNILNSLISN
jgi:hypothetical protein